MFLQCKVNSAHYIAQVVNPILLPFLRQEGDVLLQQHNAYPHMVAVMQHALHDVQQLSWLAISSDLSLIEHIWDMMKQELTLTPESATTIIELRQWVQQDGTFSFTQNNPFINKIIAYSTKKIKVNLPV